MAVDSSLSFRRRLRPPSANVLAYLVELVTRRRGWVSRPVQAAGLMLLGYSPVLRRRKSVVSHSEKSEVDLIC